MTRHSSVKNPRIVKFITDKRSAEIIFDMLLNKGVILVQLEGTLWMKLYDLASINAMGQRRAGYPWRYDRGLYYKSLRIRTK